MDPIADKLLVISALFALVSRDRLEVWVAIVIVSRELAVTLSRMAVGAQGVVVPAASWGKLKTVIQVATIFFLIAFDPTPAWLDALVYVMVAVTIISGVTTWSDSGVSCVRSRRPKRPARPLGRRPDRFAHRRRFTPHGDAIASRVLCGVQRLVCEGQQ